MINNDERIIYSKECLFDVNCTKPVEEIKEFLSQFERNGFDNPRGI